MPRISTTDAIFIPKQTLGYRGGDLEMHEGVQRTRKYVKLIQDIVLRLTNQGARVAGGESNMLNVDVVLHQRSALS